MQLDFCLDLGNILQNYKLQIYIYYTIYITIIKACWFKYYIWIIEFHIYFASLKSYEVQKCYDILDLSIFRYLFDRHFVKL